MIHSRKLAGLLIMHVGVVAASPAIAVLIFLYLTLDLRSSLHFGGVLAVGFGVLFSYLFFGAKTLLVVLLASPIFCGLARVKSGVAAFGLAAVAGAGLGWLFGQTVMTGEEKSFVEAARLSCAITGALAALALEYAWRAYAAPKILVHHPASAD